MTAEILNGKTLSQDIMKSLQEEVKSFEEKHGIVPGLVVIVVGEDPASATYVKNKELAAKRIGIRSILVSLPSNTSEAELIEQIQHYNQDPTVHGILIQLPLPKQIDMAKVIGLVNPAKDVDGFHSINLGDMIQGSEDIVPCTPRGILSILEAYHLPLAGKKVVIVGRSTIVGKPMALLALNRGATVTVCHSQTQNLKEETKQADVLIVATGQAEMIQGDFVKPGAVVIDVGISRRADGKLVGDVLFDEVVQVAGAITPVPGGVGPMTIASLMQQTIRNAKLILE